MGSAARTSLQGEFLAKVYFTADSRAIYRAMHDPGASAASTCTRPTTLPRAEIAIGNSQVQHRTMTRSPQVYTQHGAISVKSQVSFKHKRSGRLFRAGISIIAKLALPSSRSAAQHVLLTSFLLLVFLAEVYL